MAASSVVVSGLRFSVDEVTQGRVAKPRYTLNNEKTDHGIVDQGPLAYIAISYSIKNENNARKLDLGGKIDYKLVDDLGNKYHGLRKPEDFKNSTLKISKDFPAFYPGDVYAETLFFEAPVVAARKLKLVIAMPDARLGRPVEVPFDIDNRIASLPEPEQVVSPVVPPVSPQIVPSDPVPSPVLTGAPVQILSPLPGTLWERGQVARLQVAVTGGVPRQILVLALGNTFEDRAPAAVNVYDINVPLDQKTGKSLINVIAEWPDGKVSSATVSIRLKEALLLDAL